MSYTEVVLYGRTLRVYDENRIEAEFRNIKDNWRIKPSVNLHGYKGVHFKVDGKEHYIAIHRLVFYINNPSWDIYDSRHDNSIDHINGNPLDNRIENLRCVTNQENCFNYTRAKGYHWHKQKCKWESAIRVGRKTIYLGTFINEDDARNAYLTAKAKYHIIVPKTF